MTRFGVELIYSSAYCIFLFGASKSFHENGSKPAVVIMTAAVLLDMVISLLAQALGLGPGEPNNIILFAVVFGILTVWCLFPVALICWRKKNMPLYHTVISIVEICWFIDIVAFLYGLYGISSQ